MKEIKYCFESETYSAHNKVHVKKSLNVDFLWDSLALIFNLRRIPGAQKYVFKRKHFFVAESIGFSVQSATIAWSLRFPEQTNKKKTESRHQKPNKN